MSVECEVNRVCSKTNLLTRRDAVGHSFGIRTARLVERLYAREGGKTPINERKKGRRAFAKATPKTVT